MQAPGNEGFQPQRRRSPGTANSKASCPADGFQSCGGRDRFMASTYKKVLLRALFHSGV